MSSNLAKDRNPLAKRSPEIKESFSILGKTQTKQKYGIRHMYKKTFGCDRFS